MGFYNCIRMLLGKVIQTMLLPSIGIISQRGIKYLLIFPTKCGGLYEAGLQTYVTIPKQHKLQVEFFKVHDQ